MYIQVLYGVDRVRQIGLTVSRGIDSSPQGFPRALASLGGEEVRGPTSGAVPINGMGTVSVEAVKVVPDVQNLLAGKDIGSGTVAWQRHRRGR
jgi:hypothetical protein